MRRSREIWIFFSFYFLLFLISPTPAELFGVYISEFSAVVLLEHFSLTGSVGRTNSDSLFGYLLELRLDFFFPVVKGSDLYSHESDLTEGHSLRLAGRFFYEKTLTLLHFNGQWD